MTTLLAVYQNGECVGRCDASCYDAKEKTCTCICGGANHGAGLNKSLERVVEIGKTLVDEWSKVDVLSAPIEQERIPV